MERDETVAGRLTVVSHLQWLNFDPPVFLQAGETYWIEGRTLHVRATDGDLREYPARPPRPDDAR